MYLIAEIGFNHEGRLDVAEQMIRAAAQAGAHAVKFQTYRADDIALPTSPHFAAIRCGEMGRDDHARLAAVAKDCAVDFLSTPYSPWAVDLLESLDVPAYKVASMDCTNHHLLGYIARTAKPIYLSTGMATLPEIAETLAFLKEIGSGPVSLLHCMSLYPAAAADLNLAAIPLLKDLFGLTVGYSDHYPGTAACLAAAMLGAEVIETHFTLDCALPGGDHGHSADPAMLKRLIDDIQLFESMRGDKNALLARPDRKYAKDYRRGLYAAADLKAGTPLTADQLYLTRPAAELSPSDLERLTGKPLAADLARFAAVTPETVTGLRAQRSQGLMDFIDLKSNFAGLDAEDKRRLYRELWHRAERYEVLTSFPLHLDIELAGTCNLRCAHCFQSGLLTKPLGLMPFERFQRIIDEGAAKGLCAIKLQVRGESFLNPRLLDCIAYAKAKGILDVQITTNATLLDEAMAAKVLHSGLDAIIFSVDSHHGDNFASDGQAKTYAKIETSINYFLNLRQNLGLTRPWVRVQSSIEGADPEKLQITQQHLKEKFPLADIVVVNRIYNYSSEIDAFPELKSAYEFQACNYLMHRLTIFWDGAVTTCCTDFNDSFHLGDIDQNPIDEIWLSERMNQFRELHRSNRRAEMPICNTCGACVSVKTDELAIDTTKRHREDYS